jgi:23S rRNA G2069 N7-methylase RlmK/C1962 C5-methylase RlmI
MKFLARRSDIAGDYKATMIERPVRSDHADDWCSSAARNGWPATAIPGSSRARFTTENGPEDAAIADLVDSDGNGIASGFYSRHSQIRLRGVTFGEEALTPEVIASRITAAIARRRPDVRRHHECRARTACRRR